MKKLMTVFLFLLINTYSFSVLRASPHFPPVQSMIIPITEAIIIDGMPDDYYSSIQSTTVFNDLGYDGVSDFSPTFQACYDLERLYILAQIIDDHVSEIPSTNSVSPWTYDCMEVFISLDTIGTVTAYDVNTIQLRFNAGIQDSAQTPGRASQSEFNGNVFYTKTPEGWLLEVGIPWTAVLSNAQLPEDIEMYLNSINGFEVMFSDNDTDGPDARDCQTAWDEDDPSLPDLTEDLAWNNRTMFGIMSLSADEYNSPPIAYAGNDIIINENTMVSLDANASYDPEGESVSYTWTGNEYIIISDIHVADPTITAPAVSADTTYYLSLIVNDGVNDSFKDFIFITVLNNPLLNNNLDKNSSLIISPNPTNQFLNIKSENLISTLEIIDIRGDVIWLEYVNTREAEIYIGSFTAGNYIIKLNTATGIVTRQFVLE